MRLLSKLTGRQITVIVVALCATVVLTPAGVMAASSSPVQIVDPAGANQARVNVKGGLSVTPRDPVTGAQAKVDGGGHLLVGDGSGPLAVNGNVNAVPAGATALLFDGQPNGSGFTPNIATKNYRTIRVNFESQSVLSLGMNVESMNAAGTSETLMDLFSLGAGAVATRVYEVPGEAVNIHVVGSATAVHIMVFGTR